MVDDGSTDDIDKVLAAGGDSTVRVIRQPRNRGKGAAIQHGDLLQALDRPVLEGLTIESEQFEFEPEITAKVMRRGHRIYEVPISYAGREAHEGKKVTWRDGFGAVKALVQFRFTRLEKWPAPPASASIQSPGRPNPR